MRRRRPVQMAKALCADAAPEEILTVWSNWETPDGLGSGTFRRVECSGVSAQAAKFIEAACDFCAKE